MTFFFRSSRWMVAFLVAGLGIPTIVSSVSPVYANSDFNNDGRDDLAIGVPGESVGSKQLVGAVNALYGSSSGISSSGDQLWHQDVPDIRGTAGDSDSSGYSLGTGDYNGDGRADLAIGAVNDNVGTILFAGAVNVIYGSSPNGLTSSNNQLWTQDSSGVEETAEDSDQFGRALG